MDTYNIEIRRKLLEKVIGVAESLLQPANINRGEYNITKYVTLHFHVKGIKLAKGISVLCNAKLISDAKILLRPLLEATYYCEYILIDPNGITAAENILAVAWLEDKMTKDNIEKYGGVDIENMCIDDNDKKALKVKVLQRTQAIEDKYDFIIERIRKRSQDYTNLSAEEILNKEGIKNKFFLEKVNQKFNEETNTKDFWKKYKTILRDCSKSIHATDFEMNVRREDNKLEYEIGEREGSAGIILSAATTFLIRITDVSNTIFDFGANNAIQELSAEANKAL